MEVNNLEEDIFLKDIFNDKLSIYKYEDTKTYQILFNNKYYEFILDKNYPRSKPHSNVQLPDSIYEKYINKPMIFPILYECIKSEELNLDNVEEYISTIEFQNIEKITEEQFQEYKLCNKKIKHKKEGMSGKDIFLEK